MFCESDISTVPIVVAIQNLMEIMIVKIFIENNAFVIICDVSNARFFTFTLKTSSKASRIVKP